MGWNFFLLPYQKKLESQATVVPRVDNAIHRVNLYIGFPHTCLMDDDLPGAKCYPMFKQKQGQIICRCQSKGSTKSYLFLKSLKSGSASFCIANFFLLSKKNRNTFNNTSKIFSVLKMVIIHLSAAVKEWLIKICTSSWMHLENLKMEKTLGGTLEQMNAH